MIVGINKNRVIPAFLVLSFLVVSLPCVADNERGADLYENHCQECHTRDVHLRGERIRSLEVLRAWVDAWSVHAELDWTNEDTDDVTDYLNARYYHFSP